MKSIYSSVLKQFSFVLVAWLLALPLAASAQGSYDAFWAAIARNDVRTIQNLQAQGFDLNSPSPELQPPLHAAIALGSWRVAEYLIEQPGVDLNARSPADENALMMAALKGRLDLAQALIARKAHVNKPGWTPLHYAATHSGPEALALTRLMLEHHAFIDAVSPNGTTALMMAAHYGIPSVVKLLLEEGADPLMRNQQGLSAIDFAHRAGRSESAELIGAFVRGLQPRGTW